MAQKISLPRVNVSLIPDAPVRGVQPKITTFIGQMISGTATAGELQTDIDVNAEDALFGAGSQIAEMIRSFRKINTVSEINAIGIADNGSGVAATGEVAFTGTATANGTINVYVGSKDSDHKAVVAVTSGDSATDVGDALETAVTALTRSLVTAVNTTGTVALTAKNKGTVGNNIGILIDGTVAGITTAITAFASGATDPSITDIEDGIDYRTDIIMPYEFGIGDIQTWLDNRFNYNNNILDGVLFTGIVDTKANLVVIGDAENSQSTVVIVDKPVAKSTKTGNALFEMPQNIVAQFAGLRTLRLNDGSNITDYVVTREPLDNVGGVHTSSMPYFNSLMQLDPIPLGEGWTDSEVSDLNDSGLSVVGNNIAANAVITGEILTTYKTNIQGLSDLTYKFLNYVDTASASREYIFNNLKIDYAQKRLTLGTGQTGYGFATTGSVRSDMIKYYSDLTASPFVLLQGGVIEETGKTVGDYFKEALTVSFDIANGTIDITGILPLITQVREITVPLSIKFDVTA